MLIDPESLNFDLAFARVLHNSKKDFFPNNFETWIFEGRKDQYIERAKELLSADYYNPKPLCYLEVPKDDLTSRPGAIVCFEDKLVYQALVDEVARVVEPLLTPRDEKVLFSNRLDLGSEFMFDRATSYSDFLEEQYTICSSGDYRFVLVTDLSSYYERIYHHPLVSLFESFGCRNDLVQSLGGLLREWRNGQSYGLPQGLWGSDFLANMYLHEIDTYCLMKQWKYVRYVDDIRIFCGSPLEAKKCLIELSKRLRPLGQSVNSSKTDILECDKYAALITPARDKLEVIKEQIKEPRVMYAAYRVCRIGG